MQLTVDEVCQYFDVTPLLVGIALPRRDPVFIQDLQRAEIYVLEIVVVGIYKCIPGLEPAVIVVTAVTTASHFQHVREPCESAPVARRTSDARVEAGFLAR